MSTIRLTILARKQDGTLVPPRTKKNSPQLIPHMARPILVPSEAYREWERAARAGLIKQGICQRAKDADGKTVTVLVNGPPVDYPVNCRALIYRDRLVGDAVGFYQAIGDFLQDVGIVTNDKYIVQWDGTRLMKDPARPRIELELTDVGPVAPVALNLFEAE